MKPLQKKNHLLCVCCFFGILLLVFASVIVAKDTSTNQIVLFKWAFVAQTGSGDNTKIVAITEDTVLHSGDRFKMMVELQSQCFVYVLFRTSDGEIHKLFQEQSGPSGGDSTNVQRKFYIPVGDLWFLLDNDTGKEKVYLLASRSRLEKLERLVEEYASAGNDRGVLADEIVAYIKEVRKRQIRFTINPERPVQIGGTFRGTIQEPVVAENIEDFSLMISGDNFFVKTFTIEHR